ncbi:ATP-binding protein [Phaeovulum sp. NW3]|uniref:hybrid sensor histidine kinase/response regulator n=1 Tax=Phaeovulum sp. NW3 TaxID=2934933 RepID=UPI002021045C|nr:ATP-binding protein [Phaeovulum sp. NW3]MCL7466443.1 ATP-binding protein [Phaeovulum sp. NW3]
MFGTQISAGPKRVLGRLALCIHRSGLYYALATVAVGLCIAVSIFLASRVAEQIDVKTSAESDKVPWNLAQSEVELMSLQLALHDATENPAMDLNDVRLRFDIFYSRIMILTQSPLHAPLREARDVAKALDEVTRFLHHAAPIVDAPNREFRLQLRELELATAAIRPAVRTIALTGIQLSSALADKRRADFVTTLRDLAVLTVALVIFLLAAVAVLARLSAINTARARTERMMYERIGTVLANTLDAVIEVDADGRIAEFNAAAERIYGYTRDEALGMPAARLGPEQSPPTPIVDTLRNLCGTGLSLTMARHKSGRQFPVEFAVNALSDHKGESYVAFARDITGRLDRENELRQARDRAIAGEKAKQAMLQVMSHEIRTPLNGLLGTLQLLEDTNLTPEQARLAEVMRASGEFLMQHVNDVLDISQIDSGMITANPMPFTLQALVREVAANQTALALTRGNRIEVVDSLGQDRRVNSDPKWLRQILFNLISNANKFTSKGSITITLDRPDPAGPYRIAVADTGIGISQANITRIFADFVTIDQSYERTAGGTGLGLGIARRLARKLGGNLTVESQLGIGSTFTLTVPLTDLPAEPDDAAPASTAPAPSVRQLSVLMAEDNPVNRLVLRELLQREGHTVAEAHDGQEAVDLAQAQRFDLILMDISMPRMNGITATRAIRDGQGPNRATPVAALTAHASDSDRFLQAGMAEVVVKPISRAKLREAIARICGDHCPDDPDTADKPLLDAAHLQEMHDTLPHDRFARLLDSYMAEADRGFAKLAAADSALLDLDRVAQRAHKEAGSAATFGLTHLRAELIRAEQLAQSGDADALAPVLAQLPEIWQQTRRALANWRRDHAKG